MNSKNSEPLYLPTPLPDGSKIALPKEWLQNFDERGVLARFILYKPFFGECFRQFYPKFFRDERFKGVVVAMLVDSHKVDKSFTYPGDIDLLIIPYAKKHLVFSEMLAVEAKVIRGSYVQQGKSPNQFGFSQAQALYDKGFPYVAVAHFIISDHSPPHQWRKIIQGTIDKNDIVKDLKEVYVDDLPMILMERALGRLKHNRQNENIGLLSSYMNSINYDGKERGMFLPDGVACKKNPYISHELVSQVISFYRKNVNLFFNIPRYPPKTK